jgi:hypothetical protein
MFFSLYDRNWEKLFEYAEETYDLSQAEGFAMWTANAGMHRGRARKYSGRAGIFSAVTSASMKRPTGRLPELDEGEEPGFQEEAIGPQAARAGAVAKRITAVGRTARMGG